MNNQMSLLVVDDNGSLCKTMSFILEKKGYYVNIAENGFAAITMVKQRDYDVILMDLKMPRMNGVETFKKIKTIRPNANVVMMTAYAVSDLVMEAIEEGAKAVLYKPFEMDDVLKQLDKIIATK